MDLNIKKYDELYNMIVSRFDKIDNKLDNMEKKKECLDGDTLLDNQDMCELLGITKRTLARYRSKKLISYYMIGGRTYYKASEVNDFLRRKGKSLI